MFQALKKFFSNGNSEHELGVTVVGNLSEYREHAAKNITAY